MTESIEERKRKTAEQLTEMFDESLRVMIGKNNDRGDCWRDGGLCAQFIEIHSMYFRLRNLIWETGMPSGSDQAEYDRWAAQVINALTDMRNFTILAELCIKERNNDGSKYIDIRRELQK